MRKEIEVAIAKRRRAKLPKFAARVARWYLRAYDNFSYDTAANGEAFVIARVAEAGGRVFFDVGANVGDWTQLALDAGGKVHAFEIVPTTAEECERRFGKHATVNRVGLLDRAGRVTVNYFPHFSAGSSIYEYPHGDSLTLEAEVITGDSYCRERGIDHVDMLKIDTEGADHLVLAGFSQMLSAGRIGVIQFEYGRLSATTKFMLADFYQLLEPQGYRLGKLFPTYVDFKPYDVRDENLEGPNYVAARPEFAAVLA